MCYLPFTCPGCYKWVGRETSLLQVIKSDVQEIVDSKCKTLNDEILSLKAEVNSLKFDFKKSKLEHDQLVQYGRRMNLDLSGIPGDTGTPDENIEQKLMEYARKSNIDISSADIDKCHRKGKYTNAQNRRVIVKFTNSKARRRFYEGRKSLGRGIYVQDNLTPFRENLAYETRKLRRENLITKCWVSRCKVYVLLFGESRGLPINDMDAICAIRNGHQIPDH